MTEPGSSEVPISPSVQAIRNLGGVSPSVAEAKKLEFKSETPDIKMQLGEEDEEKQNGEKEYRARQYFREGQTQLEVLTTSTRKEQLVDVGRTFMAGYEDMSLHRDGSVSEYRLDDAIALVGNRKADMSYSLKDLVELDYLSYDKEGRPTFNFPGFCYTTTIEMKSRGQRGIYDPEGNLLRTEVEEEPTQVFLPGTDGQREELSKDLGQVQAEMTAREDLAKMLRWVWNQTENLEDLVKFYYMGSLTNTAMQSLCNAEGRKFVTKEVDRLLPPGGEFKKDWLQETQGGVEYRPGHEFGDAMSVALQCFEIAALSEKPAELKDLLKRPGIKFLFKVEDQDIKDIFLKPEDRGNRPLNANLVKWIGEPWRWSTKIAGPKENVENEEASRGLLTRRGNILVESKWEEAEDIFQQVERFLGGGDDSPALMKKDAKDARFIAWGLLRTTGMASELGGQLYNQPCVDGVKRDIISHDLGAMTSCDRVKVYSPNVFRNVYRYIKPEIRNFGPDGSLDKYPDRFTVAYFKQWVADIKYEEGKDECLWIKDKQSHGKRTFQEMRWGYRGGTEKDLLTGQEINLPEEAAYRLGELPWHKLHPKAFNAAALGPYIAGREGKGIFTYVKRTDWDIREVKDDGFAKSLANWLGIAMNEQTVFDGKLRGVYDGTKPLEKSEKSHDDKVKDKVKSETREYKKEFVRAWWDGLRSLPQWREWLSLHLDEVKNQDKAGSSDLRRPIDRIKYRLGHVEILTPEEAMALPSDALNQDRFS